MAVQDFIQAALVNSYSNFISSLPENYQLIFNIFVYTILIAIYSIFVFEFYRFLAKKNIIQLNLSKYNTSKYPGLRKFIATIFYLIEYIIVLPVLVFFWFAVLAFLLMLLSQEQSVSQILLVSAAVVGAIRVTSYFREDLSRDLAKMFPFTVLAIFLLSPEFFKFSAVVEKLTEIPAFFNNIFFYLVFVVAFEICIRFVYTIVLLFQGGEVQQTEEKSDK